MIPSDRILPWKTLTLEQLMPDLTEPRAASSDRALL
jgi:hypothetical protein